MPGPLLVAHLPRELRLLSPTPSIREWPLYQRKHPHEGPREESVGSDFAQSVYLCRGLPKEGVSALSSHATSFLYYLPKFQPMCFLTIKYYLIEVCVPPQLFPPLSLRGHVIFDCVSPDFNSESEIGLTNLVNPDEQRNQLFCCCCCFVFLLWN